MRGSVQTTFRTASVDDFKNVIATLPQNDVVRLYGEGYNCDARKLNAVRDRISCPGNVTDGSCVPGDIKRVRIDLINWPGVKTWGFDGLTHNPKGRGSSWRQPARLHGEQRLLHERLS